MAKKKDPTARNATFSGNYSGKYELDDFAGFAPAVEETPERTERTWGEAAKDTGVGLVKGLAKGVHDLSNAASLVLSPFVDDDPNAGIIDTTAKAIDDKLQAQKSEVIRLKEQRLGAMIQDPNVSVSDVIAYVGTNEDLLAQISAESLPSLAVGAGVTGALSKINAVRQFANAGKVRAAVVGGVGESAMIGGSVYGETGSGEHGAAGVGMGILTSALTPGNVSGMIAGRMAKKGAQEAGETITTPLAEAAAGNIVQRRLAEDTIKAAVGRTGVAIGSEATQEFGQETAQALIEQHGKTGELDTASAFKQGAVGAMAGGVMGGGFHMAMGEGAVGSRSEIEAERAALLARQAQAQQALAADPMNPVLQNEVDSARAAVAAATTDPAQRQQVADAAIASGTAEILGATDTDSAIASFNQNNQTSATLRTGAQVAEEAAAAVREVQGSYNPETAEEEVAPAPAVVTPGGPTPAGVTASGTPAIASGAPAITPDEQTIAPTPAAGRPLMASGTILASVPPGTPNADAILQVANWQAGRDPVTNISRIVAGMAGDPNETPITRPPSISPVVWEAFVRDAQMETGIMLQHDGGIGRTVREGLQEIATRGSRPGRMLAERLLATNNPYLNITVGAMQNRSGARGRVLADTLSGRVRAMEMSPTNSTESAYLHEALHALTLTWLDTVPHDDPLYRELKQLVNKVKREADSRGLNFYGTHPGGNERTKMAEFLAEAFTRSTFQTFLDSIQVESSRTGWDTFVAWVGRLIGATEPRQLSALDLALRINDDVLNRSAETAGRLEAQAAPEPAPAPAPAPEPEPTTTPTSAPAQLVRQRIADRFLNMVERELASGDVDLRAGMLRDMVMRVGTQSGLFNRYNINDDRERVIRRVALDDQVGGVAWMLDQITEAARNANSRNATPASAAPTATPASAAPTATTPLAPGELDLNTDGIQGQEIPHTRVPNGNDAFQYAIGRTTTQGVDSVFRRRADERGTYGGWRWETEITHLLPEGAAPTTTPSPAPAPSAQRRPPTVAEATARFREIGRQNGMGPNTLNDAIDMLRALVRSTTEAEVRAEIAELENTNDHSRAELLRALLAEHLAPAAPPSVRSEADLRAELDTAREGAIQLEMDRYGFTRDEAEDEVRAMEENAFREDIDQLERRIANTSRTSWATERAAFYSAVVNLRNAGFNIQAPAAAPTQSTSSTGVDAAANDRLNTAFEDALGAGYSQVVVDNILTLPNLELLAGMRRLDAGPELRSLAFAVLDVRGAIPYSLEEFNRRNNAYEAAVQAAATAGNMTPHQIRTATNNATPAGLRNIITIGAAEPTMQLASAGLDLLGERAPTQPAPAAAPAPTQDLDQLREAYVARIAGDQRMSESDARSSLAAIDQWDDDVLRHYAANGMSSEERAYMQALLDNRAAMANRTPAPAPAATPAPARSLTAAQRGAITRTRNAIIGEMRALAQRIRDNGDDPTERLQRALSAAQNSRMSRRQNSDLARRIHSLINNPNLDRANEIRWATDRMNEVLGRPMTITAQPHPASQAAQAPIAPAANAFTPPALDQDDTRIGLPTTHFASAPTTPATPSATAQVTQADLAADVDAADANLRMIAPGTWEGRTLDRARMETLSESDLARALDYTVTHSMPRTAAVIRALQNRNAFEDGQPLPHPRFVAQPRSTSSTSRWPGTAPVATRETAEYGGTPAAQQTAVPTTETVPPSIEQDYATRLESAVRSGALKRLADFWRTVIAAPGQRMFEAGDIPLDDLKAQVRANGNQLTQAHLTELKRRYNDAFHRKAVEWAAQNGEPAPAREDIITDLSGSGSSASIRLYGVGRGNPANPYLRARKADGTTPMASASLGSHNTTTGLSGAPGSSDIAYRVAADMAYLRGGSSRSSGSLLSNNNVRRQVQTMIHGIRLNDPEPFSPMVGSGGNPGEGQQAQPQAYNSLSDEEKIGANVLRTLHNAFINREGGRYLSKARALGNLVLNPDGQSYTAIGDPIDTRGFADGTVVTKRQLKDKLNELNTFDRSSSGGMGLDMLTLAMVSQQVLNDFEQNPDAGIPEVLVNMARTFGSDQGGWLMSQDTGRDYQTEIDSLMAEHAMPDTTNERRAEINREIAVIQDEMMDVTEEAPFDAAAAERMQGEFDRMAAANAEYEAFLAARASDPLYSYDTAPSDPNVANTPAAQINVTTQAVSPASQNEIRVMDERGRGWFQRILNSIRKAIQDKHVTLGTVLRALKDTRTLEAIDRFDGLRQAAFERLATEPMAEIENMLNSAGITRAEFENHLIMRHVREYNAHAAQIAPLQITRDPVTGEEIVKGYDHETRPGSGVDANGDPYTTSRADEYMAGEHKPEMLRAAEAYTRMIRGLQEYAVESGLESAATIESWNRLFPNYVPFRRDLDIEENTTGTGSGFSVREGISQRAMGSTAALVDPLPATLEMLARVADRGEKARIGQIMLGTARSRPIPMYQTKNGNWKPMWRVESMPNIRTVKRLRVYNVLDASGSPILNGAGMPIEFYNGADARAFAAGIQRSARQAQASGQNPIRAVDTGFHERVVSAHNPAYINKDNVLVIPENGENHVLVFDEQSEQAMDMVRNLKNLDSAQLNGLFKVANVFSRWTVGTATGYNPFFAPINFIRDIQSSAVNIGSAGVPGWNKRQSVALIADAVKNAPQLFNYLQAKHAATHSNGLASAITPAPDSAAEWMEFAKASGGLTGIRESFATFDDAMRSVKHLFGEGYERQRDIRQADDWANRTGEWWSKQYDDFTRWLEGSTSGEGRLKAFAKLTSKAPVAISNLNNAFELATRVSAFKSAFKAYEASGLSREEAAAKAAIVSKNVSVNFNRRGTLTSQMNALFPFFNAASQGSARLAELLFEKVQVADSGRGVSEKIKLTSIGKKVVLALPALGAMQAMMLAAAGFEDDQPPEHVRSRNFIIPTGGTGYVMVPLPLGLNALFNMGREGMDAILHPHKATEHLLNAVTEPLTAFNPLGSTPNKALVLSPAALDIPLALYMNEDAFGRQIFKEDRDPRRPTPGFTRHKEGTSESAIAFAEALNKLTGGNDYRAGAINLTGDQVEYMLGQLGGGITREAMKTGQFVAEKVTGSKPDEDRPWYKVPLAGKFVGDVGDSASIRDRLYKLSAELNSLNAEFEGLKDAKKGGEANAFRKEHPELSKRDEVEKYFNSESKLRKQRSAAQRAGDNEKVAEINEQLRVRGAALVDEIERVKAARAR